MTTEAVQVPDAALAAVRQQASIRKAAIRAAKDATNELIRRMQAADTAGVGRNEIIRQSEMARQAAFDALGLPDLQTRVEAVLAKADIPVNRMGGQYVMLQQNGTRLQAQIMWDMDNPRLDLKGSDRDDEELADAMIRVLAEEGIEVKGDPTKVWANIAAT